MEQNSPAVGAPVEPSVMQHTRGPWVTGNTDPLLFGVQRRLGTAPLGFVYGPSFPERSEVCLLYTSVAADDLHYVDLGGPRIIKKKKHNIHNL